MDSAVNFFQWGYTTLPGSTFNNMMIDYDGDYLIRQQDMNFKFYDRFQYQQVGTTGGLPDGDYFTGLAFQPYALSDATGWCGSVLASNPGALETMAGQITFDFAFDVYAQAGPGGPWTYFNTEIVRDFRMGSYGDIIVNVTTSGGGVQSYSSSAIVNNTNPTTPRDGSNPMGVVDPDFYNLVSFHGADTLSVTPQCGVLTAEWAAGQRGEGVKKFGSLLDAANQASCVAAGGVWQNSAFAGFAFIMRADGIRVIEAMDYGLYGDLGNVPTVIDGVAYNLDENGVLQPIANLSAVPIPGAMWLFGSGLLGLMGVARRA